MNGERQRQPFDEISRPKRYNSHPSGIEAIDLCECLTFCVGNAVKYLFRLGMKDAPVTELKKARWYLVRSNENDAGMYATDWQSADMREMHDRFLRLACKVREHDGAGTVLGDVLYHLMAGDVARAQERIEEEIAARETGG